MLDWWWQRCLGEEVYRGHLRTDPPEHEDIWFFVKTHQRLHCRGSTQHSGETAILCMGALFFPRALRCCPESSWTKCMWRQKCRLYVGSATWISPFQGWLGYCFCWYLLVQQLKPNSSPWYELGLNVAKPGNVARETNGFFPDHHCQHLSLRFPGLNVRFPQLNAKILPPLNLENSMPLPMGSQEGQPSFCCSHGLPNLWACVLSWNIKGSSKKCYWKSSLLYIWIYFPV